MGDAADRHPASRELAFLPRLRPGERFSHVSAARLWGFTLPLAADARVHTTVPLTQAPDRRRRVGVVGHIGTGEIASRGRAPVSDPVRTFVELGTMLALDDLVAVADWLVLTPRYARPQDPRPLLRLAELRVQVAAMRARGVRRARIAATLAREGAESPMETALRLLLLRHGCPEPELGIPLHDEQGMIGWFDMGWPALRIAVEYDGDQHRTSVAQYEKDIMRFDRAAAAGWRVVRVRSGGMKRNGRLETVARVRAAFAAAHGSVTTGGALPAAARLQSPVH